LSVAAAAEPNRILVALPALCLLAGAGLAWLAGRLGAPLMALVMLSGGLWEAQGYWNSMGAEYPRWYAESAEVQHLAKDYAGRALLDELGGEYTSQWRFLWGPARSGAGNLYLMPADYAPGLGREAAHLKAASLAGSQETLVFLDEASPATALRLQGVDRDLRLLRSQLPFFDYRRHRDLLLAYLNSGAGDPWTRSAALEEALRWSSDLGDLPPALVRMALKDPLVSSSSPLWLASQAQQSGDNAFARRLCARAMQIDPRRPCAY
jgi:hypothetical protein